MNWQVVWQTAHGIQFKFFTSWIHVAPLILLEAIINEVASSVALGDRLVLWATVEVLVFCLPHAAAIDRHAGDVGALRTAHVC